MKNIWAIILLICSWTVFVNAVKKRDLVRLESELSMLQQRVTEQADEDEQYIESPLTSPTSDTVQHKTSILPGVSTVTFGRPSTTTHHGVSTVTLVSVSVVAQSKVSTASSPRVSTASSPRVSTASSPRVSTASSSRVSTSAHSLVSTASSPIVGTSTNSFVSTASPTRVSTSSYLWISTASSPKLSSTLVSSSWSPSPSIKISDTPTFSIYTPNSGYPDNGMEYSDLPTSSSIGNSVYAGSVLFVTPTPSVSVSPLYPIEPSANITFKWQYTGLRVRPVNVTLNAVGPNSVTYDITTVDGATSEVTWNLGSVPTIQPLPNGYYGIELYDQRGLSAGSEPGHMDPCTTLTIAMYTPDLYEPYTTLANYCPTCYYSGSSSKFHEVLRPICFTFVAAFLTCAIFLYNVLS